MKIEEAQLKLNQRYPEEDLTITYFEGLSKGECTIKCNKCGWQQNFKRFADVIRKSKKRVCQNCAKHTQIKNRFKQSVESRIPNESFELHNFTTTQNECDVECLQCHNIVHYEHASSLLSKKHICTKCNPLRYLELQNKINEFSAFITDSPQWTLVTDLKNIQSSQEKIECKCNNCNEINSKTMYDYLKGIGCKCSRRGDIQQQIIDKCGDEYKILEIAKTVRQRVTLQHSCGFVYSVNSRNFIQGHGVCPKCYKKYSKGEQRIKRYLEKYNIDYETEFPVVIENHVLRFDFYLPQQDIYIEYNGEQHYHQIDFWGGKEGYEKRKYYDSLKQQYCTDKLLVIKYTEYDQIEQILSTRLNDYLERE